MRRNYRRSFGALLREAREDADCTQQELAKHLKISKMYISYIERGMRGPLDVERIRRAAVFLDVDPQPLFEAMVHTRSARGGVKLPIQHFGPDTHEDLATLACAWPKLSKRALARMAKQVPKRARK